MLIVKTITNKRRFLFMAREEKPRKVILVGDGAVGSTFAFSMKT